MIPSVKDILDLLNRIAPFHLAEEWDNSGLQVGSPDHPVSRMLIALDPTLEAVQEALSRKGHLLLCHHPLIFRTLSSVDFSKYPGQVIREAIRGDLAIVSAHTNLDQAENGINQMLARVLELEEIEGWPGNKDPDHPLLGLGRIGKFPGLRSLEEIAEWVKARTGAPQILVVGDRNRSITRVAVVGGSGGSMVTEAFQAGAELLITGDIGHHDALNALSLGLSLIDSGHFFTEWSALKLFKDYLQEEMDHLGWRVKVEFFEQESCPAQYI